MMKMNGSLPKTERLLSLKVKLAGLVKKQCIWPSKLLNLEIKVKLCISNKNY